MTIGFPIVGAGRDSACVGSFGGCRCNALGDPAWGLGLRERTVAARDANGRDANAF